MGKKLVTNKLRLHGARQLQESINEVSNTTYYIFLGDHTNHVNSSIATPNETERELTVNVYRDMIIGKRVATSDVSLMIRNVPYVSNKVYAMYDDTLDLTDLDYYSIVNATSFYHVFKCLDNNMGANSTTEPDFSHISGANTTLYQTADGYRWKYLYSVDSTTNGKFSTINYFPHVSNSSVVSSAVSGAVDIIKVETSGRGYHNYVTGTFSSGDIRVTGNTVLYAIGNTTASSTNGFYTGCMLYIASGTGIGQYARINDYFNNANGKYITIDGPFSIVPTNGTTYQIYPEVIVKGTGSETITTRAFALINAQSSNSIYRVEILNRGADYSDATCLAVANSVVGVSSVATLRPIRSPAGGHGFDSAEELSATNLGFSVKFSNNEGNTVVSGNKFQQIGLMKDPVFANVFVETTSAATGWITDEQIYKINPIRINSNVSMNTTSTSLVANGGFFTTQYTTGDYVYVENASGTSTQLGVVNTVTNATHMTLTANGFFACTESIIYKANTSSTGFVNDVLTPTSLLLTNVVGIIASSDVLIGVSSGTRATVNTIARSGVTKNFNTFVQMYKYSGILTAGTFSNNEIVYQGNLTNSNAVVHSVLNNGGDYTMYTTRQFGDFNVGSTNTIVGYTSGAILTPTADHVPELVIGSGDILYLENIEPITRSNTQSETIKIIMQF